MFRISRLGWARALALAALLSLVHSAAATATTFLMEDYFPLLEGSSWSYTGTAGDETVDRLDQKRNVNGVQTTVLKTTGGDNDGDREFVTNSPGLRIHRTISDGRNITFSPAYLKAPAITQEGQIYESSGSATAFLNGFGPFNILYESTSTVLGVDPVSVPFGTFNDALRIDTKLKVVGLIGGQLFRIRTSESEWFVENIGLVQEIGVSNGVAFERRLTGVGGPVIPEPSTVLLLGAGLLALARSRRRAS